MWALNAAGLAVRAGHAQGHAVLFQRFLGAALGNGEHERVRRVEHAEVRQGHEAPAILLDKQQHRPGRGRVGRDGDMGGAGQVQSVGSAPDRHRRLREDLTGEQIEQALWFFFGFEAWRTARGFGWNWEKSATWLAEQAAHTLLPSGG